MFGERSAKEDLEKLQGGSGDYGTDDDKCAGTGGYCWQRRTGGCTCSMLRPPRWIAPLRRKTPAIHRLETPATTFSLRIQRNKK